jgi:hypothetical protein
LITFDLIKSKSNMTSKYSSAEFTYNFMKDNNENINSVISTDTLLLRAILVQLEDLNKKFDKITPHLKSK